MLIISQISTNLYANNNCRKPCFKEGMNHEALVAQMEALKKELGKAENITGKYRKNYLDTVCKEISRAISKRKKAPLLASLKELFSEQEQTINENAETLSGLKDGLFLQNKTLLETITEQKATIDTLTASNSQKDKTINQLESKKDKTIADLQQTIANLKAELTQKDEIISGKRPYLVNDKFLGELRLTKKGAIQYQQLLPEFGNAMAAVERYKLAIHDNEYAIGHYRFPSSKDLELHQQNIQFHKEITSAEGIVNALKAKIQMLKDSGELPDEKS